MASLLLTLDGWVNNQTGQTGRQYNNDTGIFSTIATDNESVTGLSSNNTLSHKGGWDGNRWYIISATGGLHAYTPTTNSWVGPLVSGTVINSSHTANWCMSSDGAYVYILSDANDFRRYDPSLDIVTTLQTPPGSYAPSMFLTYDGSGTIYGSKGDGFPATIAKYNIATNSWTAVASGDWSASILANARGTWPAYLQGNLYLILADSGSTMRAYQYVVSGNVWNTKGTDSFTTMRASSPGGEDSDTTIRVWEAAGNPSHIYNVVTDTWTTGASSPIAFNLEGTNFAVTRVFSAAFTWYQADGTTQLPITVNLGAAVLSQTLTFHAKVKTLVGRAAGVTVSVPVNTTTDAEDPVVIAPVVGGPYTTSFVTGALNLGDEFDVFISLAPTAAMSLGFAKRFSLQVTPN